MGDMGRFNALMDKKYALLERRADREDKQADTSRFAAETGRKGLKAGETSANASMVRANAYGANVDQQSDLIKQQGKNAFYLQMDRQNFENKTATRTRKQLLEDRANAPAPQPQYGLMAKPGLQGGQETYNKATGLTKAEEMMAKRKNTAPAGNTAQPAIAQPEKTSPKLVDVSKKKKYDPNMKTYGNYPKAGMATLF